jgi:hypothetical protein
MESPKKSLIGKYYLPLDNSYSVNISSAARYPYENKHLHLAGHHMYYQEENAKLCLIVSEPFIAKIHSESDNTFKEYEMIIVEYQKSTVVVLFYDHCIQEGEYSNGVPLNWEG